MPVMRNFGLVTILRRKASSGVSAQHGIKAMVMRQLHSWQTDILISWKSHTLGSTLKLWGKKLSGQPLHKAAGLIWSKTIYTLCESSSCVCRDCYTDWISCDRCRMRKATPQCGPSCDSAKPKVGRKLCGKAGTDMGLWDPVCSLIFGFLVETQRSGE